MKYGWIDEYLMGKRGVTKDLQAEWNWIRYQIGGKMFAAILLDPNNQPYYINLKLDPLEGEALRAAYEDIIPGYYSNKRWWNSIKADGSVPDGLLQKMLDTSYGLVLRAFSGEKQRAILGLSPCGTDCAACPLHGETCRGCNEAKGRVFHMEAGKACPLYDCPARKKRLATCAACGQMPCGLWREVRDPAMDDPAFEESIRERTARLRACYGETKTEA